MTEKPNEEANSRSSQLDEENVQKLEEKSTPAKTRKRTSWSMEKFSDWCDKRRIHSDLYSVSSTESSGILWRFYSEVKTNQKKSFSHQVP